ncbi:E3 ubiquitin-protein ligase PPP1R11 [Calliphora vicina]|uniref:E3 ubiquitin-protein ligase PPP1R11 n=1 Tax=Calliphora vicina TaxID=7373 RepID=UPI00325C2F03
MEAVALPAAETVTRSQTEVITHEDVLDTASQPVLRLRLQKPKSDKKVVWHEGTVDNEHMGKKKSKCCCIYKKPVAFGESSSEDDEECEHCFGHPEKRRRNRKHDHGEHNEHNHDDNDPCPDGEHKDNAQPHE